MSAFFEKLCTFDLKTFLEGPRVIEFDDKECREIDRQVEELEMKGSGAAMEDADQFHGSSQETDRLLNRGSKATGSRDDDDGDETDSVMPQGGKYFNSRRRHYEELRIMYTDPLRPETLGIFASYFAVGVVMYFVYAAGLVYVVDTLKADAVMTIVFTSVFTLPWSFKMIFGLLIDTTPLFGYRRLTYIWLGWGIHVVANLILALLGTPDLTSVVILGFIMTSGMLLADVAHDTMNVERARLESMKVRGYLQSRAYTLRGAGLLVGATLGAFCYADDDSFSFGFSISGVFFANAMIPVLIVFPFLPSLIEFNSGMKVAPIHEQLVAIKKTLDLRAVWEPMSFIFLFNVFMLSNPAWYNFEIEGLGFDSLDLGIINVGVASFTFLGYLLYSMYLMDSSWRTVYAISIVGGVVFSFMEVILEMKWNENWGVPALVFAFGDEAFAKMTLALQTIPAAIMYVSLCPPGAEGTTYALLTTVANLAGSLAIVLSEFLVYIWNVDNDTIASGDYSGVLKLTILVKAIHFLPLVLIGNLPATKEDQEKLKQAGEKSETNGTIFVAVLVVSFLGVISATLYYIIADALETGEDTTEVDATR